MRKSNVCWLLLVVFFVVTFCQRLPFRGNCSIYFHPCVCVVSEFKTRIVHEYHMLGCGYIECQVLHAIISQMKGRIKINWSSKPKRHAHWNLSFIAQWSNVYFYVDPFWRNISQDPQERKMFHVPLKCLYFLFHALAATLCRSLWWTLDIEIYHLERKGSPEIDPIVWRRRERDVVWWCWCWWCWSLWWWWWWWWWWWYLQV